MWARPTSRASSTVLGFAEGPESRAESEAQSASGDAHAATQKNNKNATDLIGAKRWL
jgi:hypothetical protein